MPKLPYAEFFSGYDIVRRLQRQHKCINSLKSVNCMQRANFSKFCQYIFLNVQNYQIIQFYKFPCMIVHNTHLHKQEASHIIFIKIHSRVHPIDHFLTKFSQKHASPPPKSPINKSIKLRSVIRTTQQRNKDNYSPLSQKLYFYV